MRWPRLRPSWAAAPGDRSASGDRVLASAVTDDGRVVLGMRRSLLVRSDDGAEVQAWPWADVRSARWDAAARTLTLRTGERGDAVSFVLGDGAGAGALVDLVHERVSASVVLVREVQVPGGLARVVARRRPEADAGLEWSVEVDDGVAPDDPRVRALLREAAASAAEELGAP